MEVPFNYIVFSVMLLLEERNQTCFVNKERLREVIEKVTEEIVNCDQENASLLKTREFDFDGELDVLLYTYSDYFFESNGYLYLNEEVDLEEIEEVWQAIADEEDEENPFITYFDIEISGNIELLELLGIRVRKDIYDYFINLEQEIEKLYNCISEPSLASSEVSFVPRKEEVIKKIKKLTIVREVLIHNMKNLLTEAQIEDIFYYSTDELSFPISSLPAKEPEELVCKDYFSLLMSTFSLDLSLSQYNINYKLEDILNGFDKYNEWKEIRFRTDRDEFKKFYMTVLYFLSEEINNHCGSLLYYQLIDAKYTLMYSLDMLFGTKMFLQGNEINVYDYIGTEMDYKNVKKIITFFMEDILKYSDKDYGSKGIISENIIKSILIKAYYYLTGAKGLLCTPNNHSSKSERILIRSILDGQQLRSIKKPPSSL